MMIEFLEVVKCKFVKILEELRVGEKIMQRPFREVKWEAKREVKREVRGAAKRFHVS